MSQANAGKSAGAGTIHDQGYERYRGTRSAQRRRFLVIAKHVVRSAIRQRWSVLMPLIGAGATLVIGAAVMIAFGQVEARVKGPAGAMMPRADLILLGALSFFQLIGLVLAVTAATPSIAEDLQSGAFQFYFSRPLRTGDYIRGKLLGLTMLIGVSTFLGPTVMALVRVGAASDSDAMVRALPLVPKTMLVGLVATAGLVMPAAAIGAMVKKKGAAIATYLVYALVISAAAQGISFALKTPWPSLVSVDACVDAISRVIYDLPHPSPQSALPAWAGAIGVAAFTLASYLAIRWRVRSLESAGIGGGS